jgi:fructuronate reductase
MSARLSAGAVLPPEVGRPGYDAEAHGVGIVHLGLGAFHKAHQAVYTDDALAAAGGDWRIAGVSLRSPEPAAQLTPQDGRYTLIERDAGGGRARVISALAEALHLGSDRARIASLLTAPTTRIVSITVTEKGYGIDRATGGADPDHPAIAHDLAHPDAPVGVAGLLARALAERRAAGTPPFAVLCCDNLPENGPMLRGLLIEFARRAAPSLADHIAESVAFPATMVDRITPASTDATRADAERLTGYADIAAVETETFTQWAIEDRFPEGRPAWERAGALFVEDVRPFETMKLRMLNGAHSMLAYAGFLSGRKYVADVMADPALSALVRRHLAAAAETVPPVPGVDLAAYADALAERFRNPHLRHETYQIAMDGTQKLPQRLLAPAAEALAAGRPPAPFAFAVAAWMRYVVGRTDDGAFYALRDPQEARLASSASAAGGAADLAERLMATPGLFPASLRENPAWRDAVATRLAVMLETSVAHAVAREASGIGV